MGKLKMLDLFSGIGGVSLGAEMTGCIETVGFCEIEPFCQKVLKKHWPDVPIYTDIKELTAEDVGSVDIVAGGAPCQPYSVNGKRQGGKDERHLWPEMFRLVRDIRPSWMVFENVPGILSGTIDEILSDLESEGYKSWTYVYGANLFGAEHKRNRVFVIAEKRAIWPGEYIWEEGWEEPYCPVCRVEFGSNECFHDGITSWFDEKISDDPDTESQRMERMWPEGVKIPQPLVKTLLPLRNSNGQWETEPDFRRTDDGIPGRVDKHKSARLKALGNAVVPQQIYPIFWAISQMEVQK